jgi:DNA-binding MarR family transcriptional regulator
MSSYDIIVVTIATTLIVISVYLLYNLSKSRTEKNKVEQDYGIVKAIINEFNNREENQNKKIAELMVKIDVLDQKISEKNNQRQAFELSRKRTSLEILPSYNDRSLNKLRENIVPIEIKILKFISNSPKTSKEVQDSIKKSREHTSRLLKSLFEKKYLERENKGKYFVYFITDQGKSIIVE